MNIEKYTVSRDPVRYAGWPDVTLGADGKLVCAFSECTHHCVRSNTQIMLIDSADGGRTWENKRALTEETKGLAYYYNCPRINTLPGGELAVIVDKIPSASGEGSLGDCVNVLYRSKDNGKSWSAPEELPLRGIVPDKYRLLNGSRIAIAAHQYLQGHLAEYLRYSDDNGKSWSEPVLVAFESRLNLCEVCLIPLGEGKVAALLRENSGVGYDCYKSVSCDNGETWGPLVEFPLPACHRPVAQVLRDGRILVTFRLCQGGNCGMGSGAQNFFGALTDRESLLSIRRNDASVRLFPIDYDRSPRPDTGYSGHVQLPDGKVCIVNYIVDDALNVAQIRGYRLDPKELILDAELERCRFCNCPKKRCRRWKK